jgi:hypothetical protein
MMENISNNLTLLSNSNILRYIMKKTAVILFLLLSFSVFGQYAPNGRFYFTGTVNYNIPIQMELVIEDSEAVSGSYYYEDFGEIIVLDGGEVDFFDITVIEYSNFEYTGFFEGTLSNFTDDFADTFSGTWKGANGKIFPFYLVRAALFISVNLETSRNMISGAFPYFTDNRCGYLNEVMDAELSNLIKFFDDGLEFIRNKELYYGWMSKKNISIIYYSDDLISLEHSYYEYTGGAHGNSITYGDNYIYANGNWTEAVLDDLFYSGYFDILSDWILKNLLEQGASSVTDGYITDLGMDDLMYFTISPRGLEFIFSPYHVGCYAEGYYYVTVPFSVLKPYIGLNSPLYRFID